MHLKLVMSGKRNVTNKTISKFAKGLGLNTRETDYFGKPRYFFSIRRFESESRVPLEIETDPALLENGID